MALKNKLDKATTKSLRHARLRAAAGMAYVCDPNSPSVAQLHEDPRFSKVSRSTLERWATKDRWIEKRAEFLEDWKRMAKARLGTQLVQDRLDELEQLKELKEIGIARIKDEMTAPKSLEGMMKSTLEIMKYQDQLRMQIGNDVVDKTHETARGLPTDDGPGLGDDELEAAAKAALSIRRDKLRLQLGVGTTSPGEPQPDPVKPQTPTLEAEVLEEEEKDEPELL